MVLSPKLTRSDQELASGFKNLKSIEELAQILEIPAGQLLHICYKVGVEKYYKSFEIKKKSGGIRKIDSPKGSVKILQRKILRIIMISNQGGEFVHSFRSNRSIVTNAEIHKNQRHVLNVDLQNFFGTINFGRIRGLFMSAIFGHSPNVAAVLAQICCFNGTLPQGAPTSPVLSNLIGYALDRKMHALAKKYGLLYSRYADDITFSGSKKTFPSPIASFSDTSRSYGKTEIGRELVQAISDSGFQINPSKTRLQHRCHRQAVTGITVNKFPNASRDFLRNIRRDVWLWKKYGLALASNYSRDKCTPEIFRQRMFGRLAFLKMVRTSEDVIVRSLCVEVCKCDGKVPKWIAKEKESYAVRDVFLSYASEDFVIASAINEACKKEGLAIFFDKSDMGWGDSVPGKINTALAGAKFFMPVLSDVYISKAWPSKELNSAISGQVNGKKRIIPILLPGFEINKIPLIEDVLYKTWNGDPDGIAGDLRILVEKFVL